MGQKVNPIGFRVGVYLDWDSSWFARKKSSYSKMLMEDIRIRRYLEKVLERAELSKIKIEKAGENIKIVLHSGKPGLIIGRQGQEINSLRKELSQHLGVNSLDISVQEIKRPELDARLVAKNVAAQIENRAHFKKVCKRAAASTMRAGAVGVKICVAGRLGGAEIARSEWTKIGSVPLHTLRSDIDYALVEAKTKYGLIGVKVWICRGDFPLKKRI